MTHHFTRRVLALLALLPALACQASTEPGYLPPTNPNPGSPTGSQFSSLSALTAPVTIDRVGSATAKPPVVRLVNRAGQPLSGIAVTFTASAGGSVMNERVLTDQDGRASPGSWTLGAAEAEYSLVASAAGVNSVTFVVLARTFPLRGDAFDLRTIGEESLPRAYGGAGARWEVIRGHYLLMPDEYFVFGYVFRMATGVVDSSMTIGKYTVSGSTVRLLERDGYLFATGTLQQDALLVKYTDFITFDDETYIRSR